jgi:hypothetical protein
MGLIAKLVDWRGKRLMRGHLGRELLETTYREEWIRLPDGRRVYAHIHSPLGGGEYPGAVFVPGGGSAGTDYDGITEITADDVAALGFAVLHYDPSGRGRSEGEEDHWGPRQQEELAHVLNHFAGLDLVGGAGLCVVSFSIGVAIAAGALARHTVRGVNFLFDWEGPSNRYNITMDDTHEPLRAFPTSNDGFWREREPARFIGEIACGYFRYQAEEDHMQGAYKGHAIELLNRATRGNAAWSRCNDNPENTVFDEGNPEGSNWVPASLNHKGQILKYLLEAHARCTR